jgi:hypothetical protein
MFNFSEVLQFAWAVGILADRLQRLSGESFFSVGDWCHYGEVITLPAMATERLMEEFKEIADSYGVCNRTRLWSAWGYGFALEACPGQVVKDARDLTPLAWGLYEEFRFSSPTCRVIDKVAERRPLDFTWTCYR